MSLSLTILFAFIAALSLVNANESGPNIGYCTSNFGRPGPSTSILEVNATLVVPKTSDHPHPNLALYTLMLTSNDGSGFIQSIANRVEYSGWRLFARNVSADGATTHYMTGNSLNPIYGEIETFANEGDHVKMYNKFDGVSRLHTQSIFIDGFEFFRNFPWTQGISDCWHVGMECLDHNCGTVSAHRWIDTTITLDKADRDFGTVGWESVKGEKQSLDGGITWTIPLIEFPEFTFGQQ